MTTQIGILSDTHLLGPAPRFRLLVERCFADVPVILHAGDLTDLSILDAFHGKEVHAVHGNMCHASARHHLPEKKVVEIDGYTIGLIHGMGWRHHVEDHLLREFPEVDCIVSGHTHQPVCHRLYDILFINPGSFTGTGRYGAAGTYALLETGPILHGKILPVPPLD
ncbi:MAG: metallophosphoesterase family protein [Thermodesulfobacteriota bacterium]